MPIKGLTDNQRAAFPRIGVLRKGAPKPKDGNKPGQDLKWFRFVTEDQDAAYAFEAAFGPNPDHITVMLPFATVDDNLEAWQEEWGAGSLKHRCDGETCVIWQDKDGVYQHTPKPCPGNCKPTGRLMVIVPDLRRLAYVQVLTTSKHDVMELTANLRAAEDTARMMGRDLRGIPFILNRVPREVSVPREGKRVRLEKWLLHIEPAPVWVALQIEAAQRMAMSMIDAPAPAYDAPYPNGDDDEEIEHPDTEVMDEPETVGPPVPPTNGKQQPQAGLPVTGPDLLQYVNEHVLVTYDNLVQLREALAAEGLTGNNWPDAKRDPTWWKRAKEAAIKHAESKAA